MAANPRKSRPNKIDYSLIGRIVLQCQRCKADTKAAQGHDRRIRADIHHGPVRRVGGAGARLTAAGIRLGVLETRCSRSWWRKSASAWCLSQSVAIRDGAVYGFVYFALLDSMSPTLIFVAVALSLLPVMTLYGPQAALIAESFAPRLRYSGAGLGYQLASIVPGGPAPFVATALLAAYGSGYMVAMYILACCVVSIVCVSLLQDHTNKDLAVAHEGI